MGAIASIAASGIGAVGNVIAGNQAAKAQKQAAALADKRYKEARTGLTPYMEAGTDALDTYRNSIGLNGADAQKQYYDNFQTDPGWQASQDYATRGLENSNAIQGRGYGGNVIAGLGDYLQKNMLDAYKTRQSQIGGLTDMGLNATTSLGNLGQGNAATQGQFLANAGYYQGAGTANAGNAINKGLSNYGQQQAYQSGSGGGNNLFGSLFS